MGRVPDSRLAKEEDGWKLNRNQYYLEGWLATGNIRGIVGVTYTSCACRKKLSPGMILGDLHPSGNNDSLNHNLPLRTNYNLRGHRSEVTLVKWNEPYQKLATCDSSGIIFVWIKYEGRWSIELINDRSTPVTDFSWSHDGRMALICYTDGFVLVGSVTGQRYWSSMLNLEGCHTTCGIWTPDDQHVLFGTSNGNIIVIGVSGNVVTQIPIRDAVEITCMTWSCERFKMEDTEDSPPPPPPPAPGNNANNNLNDNHSATNQSSSSPFSSSQSNPSSSRTTTRELGSNNKQGRKRDFTLAVCFKDGVVFLLKNYDDLFPIVIPSCLSAVKIEWSNSGDILAICGHNLLDRESIKLFHQQPDEQTHHRQQSNEPDSASSSSSLSALNKLPKNNASSAASSLIASLTSSSTSLPSKLFINTIKFYTSQGSLRYQINLNFLLHPITAMTWGHNDKRIFIATGAVVHIAWITKKVPSLQLLSRLAVFKMIPNEDSIAKANIPSRIQALICSLFGKTLRCSLPDVNHLRDFVSKPPSGNHRLHCTLIRHDDDLVGGSTTYVLYLEYMGGLVPILKGKRASKLKPEFVIYDPQVDDEDKRDKPLNRLSRKRETSSEGEDEDSEGEGSAPDFKYHVSSSFLFRGRKTRQKRDERRQHELSATSLTSQDEEENEENSMTVVSRVVSASTPSSPCPERRLKTPLTPLLNLNRKLQMKDCRGKPSSSSTSNLTSMSHPLYWRSKGNYNNQTTTTSGSESESETNSSSSAVMRDEYGHVYSLPSPLMRRKCRRKRRSPTGNNSANNNSSDETAATSTSSRERNLGRGRNRARNHDRSTAAGVDANEHEAGEEGEDGGQRQDNHSNRNNNNIRDNHRRDSSTSSIPAEVMKPESTYMDEMPETERLILVTSNIWGTKFKILGLADWLPSTLGTISYRTSVLHLQPRQMTLQILELGDRRMTSSTGFSTSISPVNTPSPAVMFETETAVGSALTDNPLECCSSSSPGVTYFPIIAPMTPVKIICGQRKNCCPSTGNTNVASSVIHSSSLCYREVDDDSASSLSVSIPSSQHHAAPAEVMITQGSSSSSILTGYPFFHLYSGYHRHQSSSIPAAQLDHQMNPISASSMSSSPSTEFLPSSSSVMIPSSSSAIHDDRPLIPNEEEILFVRVNTHDDHNEGSTDSNQRQGHVIPLTSSPEAVLLSHYHHHHNHNHVVTAAAAKSHANSSPMNAIPPTLVQSSSYPYHYNRYPILPIPSQQHPNNTPVKVPHPRNTMIPPSPVHHPRRHHQYHLENEEDLMADDFLGQMARKLAMEYTSLSTSSFSPEFHGVLSSNKKYSNRNDILNLNTNLSADDKNIFEDPKSPSTDYDCTSNMNNSCRRRRRSNSSQTTSSSSGCFSYTASGSEGTKRGVLCGSSSSANNTESSTDSSLISSSSLEPTTNALLSSSTAVPRRGVTGTSRRQETRLNSCQDQVTTNSGNEGVSIIMTEAHTHSLPSSPSILGQTRRLPSSLMARGASFGRSILGRSSPSHPCSQGTPGTAPGTPTSSTGQVIKTRSKGRRGSRIQPEEETPSRFLSDMDRRLGPHREFILQNKAPFWNELSQVYQLDFGGRVTQESAKNFQIEHQGNQVRKDCEICCQIPFLE